MEAWYEADWEDPWSYMWVGFTGYRAQEYAGHAGFTKRTPIRKVNCGKELNSYIDGILEAHQLSYTDELKRNGYLMLFFATLMEDYKKDCSGHSQSAFLSGKCLCKACDGIYCLSLPGKNQN